MRASIPAPPEHTGNKQDLANKWTRAKMFSASDIKAAYEETNVTRAKILHPSPAQGKTMDENQNSSDRPTTEANLRRQVGK